MSDEPITRVCTVNDTLMGGPEPPPDRPWCCPVCSGAGQVPAGLYSGYWDSAGTSWVRVDCRSCKGTGIVWREE